MTVAAKLAGFVVALAAVFGVAFLTGTQSSALLVPPPDTHVNALGGLAATADGYNLAAATPELEPGADQSVEPDPDRAERGPVGALTEVLGAPAHLVAVRRDPPASSTSPRSPAQVSASSPSCHAFKVL